MLTLLNRHPRCCCCEVSREWMTMVKTSCVRSVNEWLTLNEWLWRVTFSKSDMRSVTKNVRWFIKKDARRWKVGRIFRMSFSRCEQRSSWFRSNISISSFISLFSTLYVSVTSNDIKLSVLHCLREKYEKRLIMCIRNVVFVPVMWWALEEKKGKKNSERWKVSFPFQEISLVCLFLPFFLHLLVLCFCCCVFLYAQVKFSRIGNLMGLISKGKKNERNNNTTYGKA